MSNATALAFGTPGVISLIIGSVLPNIVGLLTRESMNPGLKAGLLAGIAGLSGVLTQWLDAINNHQHFLWQAAVLSAFATWLVAEGSYLRIWKPSGVSDFLQGKFNADPPGPAPRHLKPETPADTPDTPDAPQDLLPPDPSTTTGSVLDRPQPVDLPPVEG